MNKNFRRRLLQGDLLAGTMMTLKSPEIVEMMAGIGFDWLFLDAEHASYSTGDLQALLQAAGPELACVARLAAGDEVSIKKALDIGVDGIIAPQINSAENAEHVVRCAKYSPMGTRGVGIARSNLYGLEFQESIKTANENITVVVQAEHIDAVKNIRSIVKVKGLDAVMVGPYDLSSSMGKLGQVDDPEVVGAIDEVTKACHDAGVRLGIFGVSAEAVAPYIEKGFTLVFAGCDTLLLGQAAKDLLTDLRGIQPQA